jgi:hypothetical protein
MTHEAERENDQGVGKAGLTKKTKTKLRLTKKIFLD